jgi:polysaccharide deacetylase family protein (PEP-CTERM system associated)
LDTGTAIVNGLSIDVEEYFHAVNLRRAFPDTAWPGLPRRAALGVEKVLRLLERHRQKATFFVLGWVAEHEPELVRTIAAAGHEIASHGHSHKMVGELGLAAFRDDVRRSLELLGPLSPAPIEGFRASSFSVTAETIWALAELARLGLRYDSSIFPVRHDRCGIWLRHAGRGPLQGGSIVELPLLTWRVLGQNLPAGRRLPAPVPAAHAAGAARDEPRRPSGVVTSIRGSSTTDSARGAFGDQRLGHLRHYRNLDRTEERPNGSPPSSASRRCELARGDPGAFGRMSGAPGCDVAIVGGGRGSRDRVLPVARARRPCRRRRAGARAGGAQLGAQRRPRARRQRRSGLDALGREGAEFLRAPPADFPARVRSAAPAPTCSSAPRRARHAVAGRGSPTSRRSRARCRASGTIAISSRSAATTTAWPTGASSSRASSKGRARAGRRPLRRRGRGGRTERGAVAGCACATDVAPARVVVDAAGAWPVRSRRPRAPTIPDSRRSGATCSSPSPIPRVDPAWPWIWDT